MKNRVFKTNGLGTTIIYGASEFLDKESETIELPNSLILYMAESIKEQIEEI